MLIGKIRI